MYVQYSTLDSRYSIHTHNKQPFHIFFTEHGSRKGVQYYNHRPPGTVIDCIGSAALALKNYFWTRHFMKDSPRSQLSVAYLRENVA